MKDDKISTIHTLESDLAKVVSDKDYGKNIIKVITDPEKNSYINASNIYKNDDIKKPFLNIKNLAIIFAIISIVSMSVLFYILYKPLNNIDIQGSDTGFVATSTLKNSTTTPLMIGKNILNPEIIKSTNFNNLNRGEIVIEINKIKKLLIDNKIEPYNNIGVETGVDINAFFEKIRYSGEADLLRSFDNIYTFGLYSMPDNKYESYILIKINNFDLAFKSMLSWEKYMRVDLKDIFVGNNQRKDMLSSTTQYMQADTSGIFVDKVLKNYDIREYVNNIEDMTLVHGFINNKYLLITSGESSFLDIKDRLLKENIAR